VRPHHAHRRLHRRPGVARVSTLALPWVFDGDDVFDARGIRVVAGTPEQPLEPATTRRLLEAFNRAGLEEAG